MFQGAIEGSHRIAGKSHAEGLLAGKVTDSENRIKTQPNGTSIAAQKWVSEFIPTAVKNQEGRQPRPFSFSFRFFIDGDGKIFYK